MIETYFNTRRACLHVKVKSQSENKLDKCAPAYLGSCIAGAKWWTKKSSKYYENAGTS